MLSTKSAVGVILFFVVAAFLLVETEAVLPCAGEGGTCGGRGGVNCCSGDCVGGKPEVDVPGTCRSEKMIEVCAGEGGTCGGLGGMICCSGNCVGGRPEIDIPGTCRSLCVQKGGKCGGLGGVNCCSGECVGEQLKWDGPGTCRSFKKIPIHEVAIE